MEYVIVFNGSVEFLTGNLEMIGDKICELKKQGYKNEDFLILCPTKSYCYSVKTKSANEIKYEMDYIKDIESDNQNRWLLKKFCFTSLSYPIFSIQKCMYSSSWIFNSQPNPICPNRREEVLSFAK